MNVLLSLCHYRISFTTKYGETVGTDFLEKSVLNWGIWF